MSLKPQALLVMNSGTFADQFDSTRLERLAGLVDLGEQPWTDSLDAPELAGPPGRGGDPPHQLGGSAAQLLSGWTACPSCGQSSTVQEQSAASLATNCGIAASW